jgi:hypothetical protein
VFNFDATEWQVYSFKVFVRLLVDATFVVKVVKEASEFKSWAVEHKNREEWGESELAVLRRLNLRYFSPREVANLLCFPPEFSKLYEGKND